MSPLKYVAFYVRCFGFAGLVHFASSSVLEIIKQDLKRFRDIKLKHRRIALLNFNVLITTLILA